MIGPIGPIRPMSLYNFVYNLQRKSKKAKKRILVLLLFFSFAVLLVVWVFMLKSQLSRVSLSGEAGPAKLLGEDQKLLSPMAALVEGFKGFKNDLTKKIGEYKGKISAEPEKIRPVYELPIE